MITYRVTEHVSGLSYTFEGSKEELIKFYKAWKDRLSPGWENEETGQQYLRETEAWIESHGNLRIWELPHNKKSLEETIVAEKVMEVSI